MDAPQQTISAENQCFCQNSCNQDGSSILHVQFRCLCQSPTRYCICWFVKIIKKEHFKPYFTCDKCHDKVKSWDVVQTQGVLVQEEVGRTRQCKRKLSVLYENEQIVSSHTIPEPTLNRNPQQYHENLLEAQKNQTVILAMTCPNMNDTDERNLNVNALEMFGNNFDLSEHANEKQKTTIENIFIILHSVLLCSSLTNVQNLQQKFGAPSRKSIDEIVNDDDSVLFRCMHALATGRRLKNSKDNGGARWANLRASIFAASDIIRNAAEHTTGALKQIVGNQLVANPVSQSVCKILNKLGIAPSQQGYRLKHILQSDLTMDAHDDLS